jgi:hypothetical protein
MQIGGENNSLGWCTCSKVEKDHNVEKVKALHLIARASTPKVDHIFMNDNVLANNSGGEWPVMLSSLN